MTKSAYTLLLLCVFFFCSAQSSCQNQPIPAGALETVGKVTANQATIQLTASDACTPDVEFQLWYDTEPKDPGQYAYHTLILTDFAEHEPIIFQLVMLQPDTQYYYRVAYGIAGQWKYRPEFTFHTQRP